MTGLHLHPAVAVARATLGELGRRRWAATLVVALPLVLLAIGPAPRRPTFVAVAAGWSVAMLALFSSAAARPVERRLWVAGAARVGLYAGRQLALWAVGLAVAALCWVAARAAGTPDPGALAGALLAAVLVGVPLGVLVAQGLPREMDAALLMIGVLALTLTAQAGWTRALPFWSVGALLGTTGDPDVQPGAALVHAAVALVVLTVAGALAHRTRLARRAR